MDGNLYDVQCLLKNSSNPESFTSHYKEHFKYTTSYTDPHMCCYCLLFKHSPDGVACPNHEVLVFQPRTGDNTGLDSVNINKPYYLVSPSHLLQPCSGSFVSPPDLHPTAPPSVTVRHCFTSLCRT